MEKILLHRKSVDQTARFYDFEAETYDSSRYASLSGRRRDHFHRKTLAAFLQGEVSPEEEVLELGCGTGRLTLDVATYLHNVVGVDISPGMLNLAKSRLDKTGPSRVSLISGDVGGLPFKENSFAAAYAILVLNLLPDLEAVLGEIARVTRKGGVLVFNLPNLSSIYFPAGLYVNLRGKTVTRNQWGYRYSHWYTRGRVERLLRGAGFVVERIVGQPAHLEWWDGVDPADSAPLGRFFCKSLYYKARRR